VRYTELAPTRFSGLPLEQATDSARFFGRMVRAIEIDLGGRRQLSRIETELVHAFAGAATAVNFMNRQVVLGEGSEIDLASFATLASTMLRIGSRLGLARRSKDVTPTESVREIIQEANRCCDDDAVAAVD